MPSLIEVIFCFVWIVLALRQISGQTGDVIGAMQKLSELAGWGVTVYLFA